MNVVGEDRISKLPDPLLHHILSFLPTKCAVSTTILSKRWKDVWVYVPVLDFLYWEPPRIIFCRNEGNDEEAIILETNKFMDFVDRILLLCNMVNINKFCLNCESGFFDHKRVNAWITTAINCGVEEFIFSGSYSYPSNGKMIPDSLFTSETLTKLDFQIQEKDRLDLPESISLPGLKILRLTNIVYHDKKLAGKLFSNCPVLEELCLANGGLQNFYKIHVSAPSLKSFSLTCCLRSNMEDFMPIKVLKLAQDLSTGFPTFGNLIHLEVYDIHYVHMKTLLDFLDFSPNLKSLVINQVEFSGEVKENSMKFHKVPICLECLESFEIQQFNRNPKELEIVKFVLKYARVLQTVILGISYTLEENYIGPCQKKKNLKAKEEALNKKILMQLRTSSWASPGAVIKFSRS